MSLGAVFADGEVARFYRRRAPYPDEILTTLGGLLVAPRRVLDLGAGTGALARRMLVFAERVDAVDPSSAMIDEGRRLPGGKDRRLRWIEGRVEEAPLSPPYGLITAGASLHWLDLDVVLPRLRAVLAPNAVMAVADTEIVHGPYWADVLAIIREYSEAQDHTETADLMEDLGRSGRFAIHGRLRTEPVPFDQPTEEYIEMLHSTSTLARIRMGDRAQRFDDDLRRVFARHGLERLHFDVIGVITWGRPT